MTTRHATCSCGQLNLTIEGEPARISMCHCLECQRRTGAVISNQASFHREQITFAGKSTAWTRTAESGNAITFHFCPTCGSTGIRGGPRLSRLPCRRHRQLRRSGFSRAHNLCSGRVPPLLARAPDRHTTTTCTEAEPKPSVQQFEVLLRLDACCASAT